MPPRGRSFPVVRETSQDCHLPLVVELLRDTRFWREEVGTEPPEVEGLGKTKLTRMVKRRDTSPAATKP